MLAGDVSDARQNTGAGETSQRRSIGRLTDRLAAFQGEKSRDVDEEAPRQVFRRPTASQLIAPSTPSAPSVGAPDAEGDMLKSAVESAQNFPGIPREGEERSTHSTEGLKRAVESAEGSPRVPPKVNDTQNSNVVGRDVGHLKIGAGRKSFMKQASFSGSIKKLHDDDADKASGLKKLGSPFAQQHDGEQASAGKPAVVKGMFGRPTAAQLLAGNS